MSSGRIHKTMMNAKVGFVFYFVSIILAFFSRRIFLECLGDEFIGLSGTLYSILNFLNITEMGIGTCIGYFLYRPIEQNDRSKMCEIVSLFGYLYSIIGSIIFAGAVVVSAFFPLMFADKGVSLPLVYYTFYGLLISQLITYFLNYRQILLDSDQKTYKISIWTQTGSTLTTIVQIFLAYYTHSPYIWVTVAVAFCFVTCLLLNWVIRREYPWLTTDRSNGRAILRKYPDILVKAKQIVIHRLKNFFLSKSDEILIFAFESLKMVAYYSNYVMIVGKLTALFNSVLVGMNASIGNLVAEGKEWNIRKVFWEYLTFRYWTTGALIISLTFLVGPLITWWLGEQYILDDHIVMLILLNMYIMLTRPAVDLFINAYGLYDDVWAAWTEGGINLAVTLVAGYYLGLTGILLGKVVSMMLMIVIWKPIYLYRSGFKRSVGEYFCRIGLHLALLFGILAANYFLIRATGWTVEPTLASMLLYVVCILLPVLVIYSLLVFWLCQGGRDLLHRIPIHKILKSK